MIQLRNSTTLFEPLDCSHLMSKYRGKYHRFPGIGKRKANKAGASYLTITWVAALVISHLTFLNAGRRNWIASSQTLNAPRLDARSKRLALKLTRTEMKNTLRQRRGLKSIWDASSRKSEDHPYLANTMGCLFHLFSD